MNLLQEIAQLLGEAVWVVSSQKNLHLIRHSILFLGFLNETDKTDNRHVTVNYVNK
jgi:hypothetical protein